MINYINYYFELRKEYSKECKKCYPFNKDSRELKHIIKNLKKLDNWMENDKNVPNWVYFRLANEMI